MISNGDKLLAVVLFGAFACAVADSGGCSSSPASPAKTAQREAEFCAARAAYRVVAAAAAGALDPAPGSPRANLEAAEDAFCRTLSDGGP